MRHDRKHCADLGNGTYLNPVIFSGGDNSTLKDGRDYYLTYGGGGPRGCPIYHSRDLVNWELLYYAMTESSLGFWAPDLIKYGDTYYIYAFVPTEDPHWNYGDVYVITTKDIRHGPWSEPILVYKNIPSIDPGHVVGEDGKRYLYMSQNMYFPLTDDGLHAAGHYKLVYPDWPIPDEWDVEGMCTEGPKLLWKDGWLYLTTAQGGTLGPPTSHMVVSLRSRSVHRPWELSPYNAIKHCDSDEEYWQSKGHGTLILGPDNEHWYLLYGGFRKGFRSTCGKATLLEPVVWDEDGWWRVDPAWREDEPIPMPAGGEKVTDGICLSDDFTRDTALGIQWCPSDFTTERERVSFSEEGLTLIGTGDHLLNSRPILLSREHISQEITVELTAEYHAIAGICFGSPFGNFMNPTHGTLCGVAVTQDVIRVYNNNARWMHVREHEPKNERADWSGNHIWLKLINRKNIVSPWYSYDGVHWKKINMCFDISSWSRVRCGIFCAGHGSATFRQFLYNGLDADAQ